MVWLRRLWVTTVNYEYWPWWLFFMPIIPVYLYYAIRLRSPVYFTVANPGIEYGGFFGERKNEIMANIPEKYLARSRYFTTDSLAEEVLENLSSDNWSFPLVVKPDVGERGDEVVVVQNEVELSRHIKSLNYPVVIQEYIDYEIELGVLYCRIPGEENGRVTSITRKGFLKVVGDGYSSIEKLLTKSNRGFLQVKRLKKERPEFLKDVPQKGVTVLVEPVGNHCLGTEFINSNQLINQDLHKVFDKISIPFKGFYYGRYDLKIKSIEGMYRGEGIKIFELNGVTSEPGHIYDSGMTLVSAYRDVIAHQRLVYNVCKANMRNGERPAPILEILGRAWQHFFKGKR